MAGNSRTTEVKIEQVVKRFDTRNGEVVALNGIDLEIAKDEFVCIVGPSGCGKSTLLNLIAGLSKPTSGKVYVNGKEVEGPGSERGVVFQQYALFPWLTVKKNVEYGLKLQGMSRKEASAEATRYIEMVDLKQFENAYPKELSAKEFGFFNAYGLDVELIEFGDGTAEIAAMASGDIDFAMIGHGAHALCIEGSAAVFYADAIGLSSAIIANRTRNINSLEDLRGKSVAYVAGTSSEELLVLALSKANMTIDDIEAVNFDVSGMVTAMASGQVDAAASSQPYTSTIKAQLGEDFLQLCEDRDYLDERVLMNSEICTAEFARKNPDVLVRIACALLEAGDYRSEHIKDVAAVVAKQCQGDKETFLTLTEECMWLSGEEVNGYVKDDSLIGFYENAQTAFLNSGRLEQPVPVEDYVMLDIIKSACDIVYGQ